MSFSHIIRQCVCSSTIRFVPCAFSINKQFRTCANAFPNEFTVRSYEYCAGKHWILYWIQENKTATYFRRSRLFTYDIDFNFKIMNFPNMCSNIQASPAYGVCVSRFHGDDFCLSAPIFVGDLGHLMLFLLLSRSGFSCDVTGCSDLGLLMCPCCDSG